MLDYTMCFSQGRSTSIRPEFVTQDLPKEDDVHNPSSPRAPSSSDETEDSEHVRSPFPYAAQTIFSMGPVINILADARGPRSVNEAAKSELRTVWATSAVQYDELPLDMMWNNAK